MPIRNKALFGASAGMLLGAIHPCAAQTAASAASSGAPGTSQIGEIIVTAQKRSERLVDVPMSVSAATGEQLRRRGVTQVADLAKVVPGFTFQPSNYGTPVFSIRGIGFFDIAVAVAPTVSVYVDQVPLPYSVMTEGAAVDLERAEILKGPQGTLFGQNSTGGAINFIANKPTNQFSAGAGISYGNFDAVNANGFVSGPIADGLTGRIALSTDQSGGWQQSETRSASLGGKDFTTGRIILDWKPRDDLRFELNLNGWVDRSETQAAQFVLYAPAVANGVQDQVAALSSYKPAPDNDRIADWAPNANYRRNDYFFQPSLRADWDINRAMMLTSITSLSNLKQLSPNDTDGTDLKNFFMTIHAQIQSISQELRLSGAAAGDALKWMIGGNYEHDITHDQQYGQSYGTSSSLFGVRYHNFINANNQDVDTKAAFGSLDYTFAHQVTVSASLRYTRAGDSFHGCLYDSGDGEAAAAISQVAARPIAPGACLTLDPATFIAVPVVRLSLNQDNLSWRTGVSWKPDSATLVYANITQGYKAGSFPTVPGLFINQFDPVPQESVLAYEAGFRRALFDRTLQLSGAAFYYDYRDKQVLGYVSTVFGNLPGLVSIPQSSVTGAEADASWKPVDHLTLSGGATYVDSRVDKRFLTNDPFSNVVDIKGEQFPNTPPWQISGDAQYDFPVANTLDAYVGASGHYRTSSVAAFGDQPTFKIPAYGTVDLRAGLQSVSGHWRAEIWARNVADQFYVTNVTHVLDTVARITGMPATYGVTLNYRY